jgi:hypothetical protein
VNATDYVRKNPCGFTSHFSEIYAMLSEKFSPSALTSIDEVRCRDRLREKVHLLMALLRPTATRFMAQKRQEIG